MAKLQPSAGAVVFLAFLLSASLLAPASAGGAPGAFPLGWISGCRGSIADCLAGDEFDVGSEVSRRILSTSGYISYGALRRDTTPCSRRGASYYNCRPGAQANPYSRSCSTISQCRG
ncbi:rapid alkalinization factor-like [Zingiber officinale]|uniref:Uncharacterized protein n=1 Tax=Zingiber officinale TaxID=94328 RepID=A0A8J5GNS9_ZINOF|nr:rapid alkalinization factor-like [Zingiber officinale]KAG6508652.1 hypothetical protein ZIOFF_034032 [Zingiber officinale]